MAEEWSEWFEHDGNGVPKRVIGKLTEVEALSATGEVQVESGVPTEADVQKAKHWDWAYYRAWSEEYGWNWSKVIRYRIQRPPALLSLIDLAESVEPLRPETVKALTS